MQRRGLSSFERTLLAYRKFVRNVFAHNVVMIGFGIAGVSAGFWAISEGLTIDQQVTRRNLFMFLAGTCFFVFGSMLIEAIIKFSRGLSD